MLVRNAQKMSVYVMYALSSAFSGVEVSVGEIAALASVAYIILRFAAAIISRRRKARLRSAVVSSLRLVSVYALSFALIWLPIAGTPSIPFSASRRSAPSVYALCEELALKANGQYKYYDADAGNVTQRVGEALLRLTGRESRAKFSIWPVWMRKVNLAGLCFPWSGEAVVRGDMPRIALPFVMAHESAHQIGYGPEYEANYIAYRALEGDEGLSYSSTLFALYYSMEALRPLSASDYNCVAALMDKAVFADYATVASFSRRDAGTKGGVADAFLRLSGQAGRESYNLMVDFLLSDAPILAADEVNTD